MVVQLFGETRSFQGLGRSSLAQALLTLLPLNKITYVTDRHCILTPCITVVHSLIVTLAMPRFPFPYRAYLWRTDVTYLVDSLVKVADVVLNDATTWCSGPG